MLLDCDAALCAAQKPNEFTSSIACRPPLRRKREAGRPICSWWC